MNRRAAIIVAAVAAMLGLTVVVVEANTDPYPPMRDCLAIADAGRVPPSPPC